MKIKYKKNAFNGLFILLILSLTGCFNQELWHQFLNITVDVVPDRFQFEKDFKKVSVPIISSLPLDQMHHHTRTLVIIIHGGGLNAKGTFETAGEMVDNLEDPRRRFLVFAPQFIEGVELREKGVLFWDKKWRAGGLSLSTGLNKDMPPVSSFEVIDRLIDHAVKMNPGIRQVLILGHSAGGQFVIRYAATNGHHDLMKLRDVSTWYVAANPSSYLYLNATRYQMASGGNIEKTPENKLDGCSDYNNYKYGLEKPYGYAKDLSNELIKQQFFSRPVIFLLGVNDTERNWSLDISCPGDLQGENRYQRGILYKYHLGQITGEGEAKQHNWIEIPDVGHDTAEMLTHPVFIKHLQALKKDRALF